VKNRKFSEFRNALAAALPDACNAVALGVQDLGAMAGGLPQAIERDASGVPFAWRLFPVGRTEITRNGNERIVLDFTPEMFQEIVGYFQEKGGKIPLDSRHFLYRLAEKFGVDESEVLRLLPYGRGTFGYADLELRDDGLWAVNVEYVPLARDLMAEGIFRWFSPVLRGLADGRLRITSVAFENEPAINNLDAIAASADTKPRTLTLAEIGRAVDAIAASANQISRNRHPKTEPAKEKSVKKLLTALAGLLGMDSLSLGADQDAPEGVVEKIETLKNELPGLRKVKSAADSFLGAVRDTLALGADADLNAAQGAILGLAEKARQADGLKTRVDALELAAETRKRDELIEQGRTAGKLTDGPQLEWARKQDSVALGAFLAVAPVVVQGRIDRTHVTAPDSVALSASDREVCKLIGIKEADFLATKKAKAEAGK
jgi:phage I-like protein